MADVDYECRTCGGHFSVEQDDPEPDGDFPFCYDCIEVIFTDRSHGGDGDPWTPELIRQARGLS